MTTTDRGRLPVRLGEVRETLLAGVYARAVETRKKHGILRDPKADEIVAAMDHDFGEFDGSAALPLAVLRTLILDEWVRGFLADHPGGTVVELGVGLGSRFERLDDGLAHWVESDLPDSLELRRRFFDEGPRRRMFAASAPDATWPENVQDLPGPYLFVIEGVLARVSEERARDVLGGIARTFPGARIAFDSAAVEDWGAGLTVAETCGPADPPKAVSARLGFRRRRRLAEVRAEARAAVRDGADAFRVSLCRTSRPHEGDATAWAASARLCAIGNEVPLSHEELAGSPSRLPDLVHCELPATALAKDLAPVVLLHGWAGSVADWDDVAPALAADRRVVAYDHRGHGGSTKFGDPDAYTLDALVSDLAAFADRVTPGPVHLIGHSMGGITALRYAIAHPDRVRSLVLVSTAPRPSAAPSVRLLFGFLNRLVDKRGMAPLEWYVRHRVRLPEDTPAEERARLERQGDALVGMDPIAFVAFSKALQKYPSLLGELGAITCPVTVVNGARDTGLRSGARQFAARITGCRVEVVPGAGHSPQTEAPGAWLAAVREHLARTPEYSNSRISDARW